jgi:hypothetical protein
LVPFLVVARCPATLGTNLQQRLEHWQFSDEDLGWARAELLKLVNANRAEANLGPLKLDDLACRVANEGRKEIPRCSGLHSVRVSSLAFSVTILLCVA